jgi:tRNA pseudouridine38-40 synthase
MKNVHIVFSYDGSSFLGYQIQNEARTVQYELIKAIEKINGEKTKVDASGRTDRGVHAIEQHAVFKSNRNMLEEDFKKALNGLLPEDIYIKDVIFEDDDFHPRFSVKNKTYLYKINLGEYNAFERNYVYQLNKDVDIALLKSFTKYSNDLNEE